jgi:enoyl-CoA hydratase
MSFQAVLSTIDKGILTITINRPDKLNALNQQVLSDLDDAILGAYQNEDVKGIIITGSGNKAFVAGADISEFIHLDKKRAHDLSTLGHAILHRIENCPKPVIAAVNGFALGGGCELAMACHLRVASENARFGQPEVKLGILPGYAGTQRLIQLIGKGKAFELLMTADIIGAEEALQLGLVNHVVSSEQLFPKCLEILNKIIGQSPVAIKGVIKCVNAFFTTGINGFETEIAEFSACFDHDDFKEGATAFMEKRAPKFTGI